MRRNRNAKIVATLGPASTTRETIEALFKAGADVFRLEKPAAIRLLDAIVEEADAVMVARGDLGVEMPAEQVPAIQKRIIRACRKAGKPVIVATQMLDSMVTAPVPTRAEASVAYTTSGYSALRMARERPRAPIIGMTPRQSTARRLAMVWGVHSDLCHEVFVVLEVREHACRTVHHEGFGNTGQTVVISAGMPFGTPGTTNLLRIALRIRSNRS